MLLFHDSFDNYSVIDDLLMNWDSIESIGSWAYHSTGGILNTGRVRCIIDDAALIKMLRPLSGPIEKTIRFAGWFKSSSPDYDVIVRLIDATTSRDHEIITDTSGRVGIAISNDTSGSTPVYWGTINVCDGNWHFIQVYIKNDLTNGDLKVIVDNVVQVDQVGIDTAVGSEEILRFTHLELTTPNTDGEWDDIIVWDDTTGDNFTGELEGIRYIRPLRPNGAGGSTAFSVTGAATNHEAVDESGLHDELTSFVAGDVSGQKDLYTVEDLPGSVTAVDAVIVTAIAQTDAGSRTQMDLKIKSGTTEAGGGSEEITSDIWKLKRAAFGFNPDTSSTWTPAEVNAVEIGVEAI